MEKKIAKKKMKKRYLILSILVIFSIVVVIAISGAKAYIEANLNKLVDLPVTDVDLMKINDGSFYGSYKAFPVSVEVKVTVVNHKITGIELVKHDNGQGKPAEIIPGKVVAAQSLEVDIVSGATYSSKVILKAIENALQKASK